MLAIAVGALAARGAPARVDDGGLITHFAIAATASADPPVTIVVDLSEPEPGSEIAIATSPADGADTVR